MDKEQLENGTVLEIDFTKLARAQGTSHDKIDSMLQADRLVTPVVVQDARSKDVLVIAYTNREAFDATMKTGTLTLWSTSRNELWVKGKTSGNTFRVVEVFVNCEQNSLLYMVVPMGNGMCHTLSAQKAARTSCYYRKVDQTPGAVSGGAMTLTKIEP